MGKSTSLPRDTGHLIKELILEGQLRRKTFGGVVIPLDHLPINDEPVLVHDRFQSINDSGFLLFGVFYLLKKTGISAIMRDVSLGSGPDPLPCGRGRGPVFRRTAARPGRPKR